MRHHLMEEPYAVIPPVRICAGYPTISAVNTDEIKEIYGDRDH
jgi:hypothetical protein